MTARLHTRLSAEPISVTAAHDFCADPRAGAVVVFAGTVRDHAEGRAVAALSYEAWEERAAAGPADLAASCAARWPELCAVWIEHRVGELVIGDPAVVVGASSPHRPAAFAAASWAIETLKADVPIWKREQWAEGGAHWPGAT